MPASGHRGKVNCYKASRRIILICPKCGENNSNDFRFCGMCGAPLDVRRPANAAVSPNTPPASPSKIVAPLVEPQFDEARLVEPKIVVRKVADTKIVDPQTPPPQNVYSKTVESPIARPAYTNVRSAPRTPAFENTTGAVGQQVPPISGPSMLGLNQPPSHPVPANPTPPHPPGIDSLREQSFPGLSSYLEPEQSKHSGRRMVVLVLLLIALGASGWWTYGYLEGSGTLKSAALQTEVQNTSAANGAPVDSPNSTQSDKLSSTADTPESQRPAQPSSAQPPADTSPAVAPGLSDTARTGPDASQQKAATDSAPVAKASPASPREAIAAKSLQKREPRLNSAKVSRLSQTPAEDSGADEFRQGEAFLYGRGAPENCDQAVKHLKAASAKSNAKARSAFGTMYATGHCVPRDLPTSYQWFAMALRADPNNQILEKDLSAVWNQMTPPERQLATRMKQ
ncbi:MAG: zinc-ribbon domain-containing protein [Terriglobales bacterium]